jgi:hypothetical protein
LTVASLLTRITNCRFCDDLVDQETILGQGPLTRVFLSRRLPGPPPLDPALALLLLRGELQFLAVTGHRSHPRPPSASIESLRDHPHGWVTKIEAVSDGRS